MSQKLNGGGRERVSQVPDLHFKICNLGPKLASFFLPKTALKPAENGQMKGNSGYSTHAGRLPRAEEPSNCTTCSAKRPQEAPKSPRLWGRCRTVRARCAHGACTVRARFNVFGMVAQLVPR